VGRPAKVCWTEPPSPPCLPASGCTPCLAALTLSGLLWAWRTLQKAKKEEEGEEDDEPEESEVGRGAPRQPKPACLQLAVGGWCRVVVQASRWCAAPEACPGCSAAEGCRLRMRWRKVTKGRRARRRSFPPRRTVGRAAGGPASLPLRQTRCVGCLGAASRDGLDSASLGWRPCCYCVRALSSILQLVPNPAGRGTTDGRGGGGRAS
jgi:hypothetical protein